MRQASIGSGGAITDWAAMEAIIAASGAVCELSMDDERITIEVDVEALIAAFEDETVVMSKAQLEWLLDESLRQFLTPPRLPTMESCAPREDYGTEGDAREVA